MRPVTIISCIEFPEWIVTASTDLGMHDGVCCCLWVVAFASSIDGFEVKAGVRDQLGHLEEMVDVAAGASDGWL